MPAVQTITKELYNPYRHQQAVHESKAKVKMLAWPAGSGKDICAIAEAVIRFYELIEIWSARPPEMDPKYMIWAVAPTQKLAEQLWTDIKNYFPREFWAGSNPVVDSKGAQQLRLRGVNPDDKALIKVRSTHNADYRTELVSDPVDFVLMTEAGLIPNDAWSLLQIRLMRPGRIKHSGACLDGTPWGMTNPADPMEDHWQWAMVKNGRNPAVFDFLQSWYWYEDKYKPEFLDPEFGVLDHPILSLTAEGRAEIERQRTNPDMSPREFERSVLGKFLTAVSGRPVTPDFNAGMFVFDNKYDPKSTLYRLWDFGRHYPAVMFFQLTRNNVWEVLREFVPVKQDLTDEMLAKLIVEFTARALPNLDSDKLRDLGDFEANQEGDQRKESTTQMLENNYGIILETEPTKPGDEALAIDTINGRLAYSGGGVSIRINPRCTMTIKCFEGEWKFLVKKVNDAEKIFEAVAEIHPYIDIWDCFKYFVVNVIKPETEDRRRENKARKSKLVKQIDPMTGQEVYV